jgi:MFS transporter, DHA1 family, multidrug resistance protein
MDAMRDAPFGQLVRYLTGRKYFQYPEEMSDFVVPDWYLASSDSSIDSDAEKQEVLSSEPDRHNLSSHLAVSNTVTREDLERQATATSSLKRSLTVERTRTLPYTNERLQIEQQISLEKATSKPIAPTKTADGLLLVDWYTTDDPGTVISCCSSSVSDFTQPIHRTGASTRRLR